MTLLLKIYTSLVFAYLICSYICMYVCKYFSVPPRLFPILKIHIDGEQAQKVIDSIIHHSCLFFFSCRSSSSFSTLISSPFMRDHELAGRGAALCNKKRTILNPKPERVSITLISLLPFLSPPSSCSPVPLLLPSLFLDSQNDNHHCHALLLENLPLLAFFLGFSLLFSLLLLPSFF